MTRALRSLALAVAVAYGASAVPAFAQFEGLDLSGKSKKKKGAADKKGKKGKEAPAEAPKAE
jgi:hypothetical protein